MNVLCGGRSGVSPGSAPAGAVASGLRCHLAVATSGTDRDLRRFTGPWSRMSKFKEGLNSNFTNHQ
ncbi:hypothetical protein J6590_006305 [Homalodisca vitripennis]|nr:hypothetical protein J6590_006305 [Homalodisca vitripennis]